MTVTCFCQCISIAIHPPICLSVCLINPCYNLLLKTFLILTNTFCVSKKYARSSSSYLCVTIDFLIMSPVGLLLVASHGVPDKRERKCSHKEVERQGRSGIEWPELLAGRRFSLANPKKARLKWVSSLRHECSDRTLCGVRGWCALPWAALLSANSLGLSTCFPMVVVAGVSKQKW